jgi:hypothetical protein
VIKRAASPHHSLEVRKMRRLFFAFSVVPLALTTGCQAKLVALGDIPDSSTEPTEIFDGGAGPDTGTGWETGVSTDSGLGWDTGVASDSGLSWDGSSRLCEAPDASPPDDAGPASCGCSRRPDATPTFACPPGDGSSTSALIGAAGGTLRLAGVATDVTFPPGAFSTPTNAAFTETTIPPPYDILDWSPVFRIEPAGVTLAVPARIEIPWQNNSGAVPAGLTLWYSPDGSCFSPVPGAYENAGFFQAATTTLGYFIAGVARDSSTASCP